MSTAVAVIDARDDDVAVLPAMTLSVAAEQMKALSAFVGAQLKEGEDWGTIPRTPKPTLYQPGAQKILFYFGLAAVPHLEREILTPEFVSKTYRVDIINQRTGKIVAGCAGSCNSAEQRFDKIKGDLRSTENTCDKMAQKRALVGATLIATRASGIYTQDVDDLPPEQLANDRPAPAQDVVPTAETLIPFGKMKGKLLSDTAVDDGYLTWLCTAEKYGKHTERWNDLAAGELERRGKGA